MTTQTLEQVIDNLDRYPIANYAGHRLASALPALRTFLAAADAQRAELLKHARFRVHSTDGYANIPSLSLDEAERILHEKQMHSPARTWEVLPQSEEAERVVAWDEARAALLKALAKK